MAKYVSLTLNGMILLLNIFTATMYAKRYVGKRNNSFNKSILVKAAIVFRQYVEVGLNTFLPFCHY